MTGEPTIAKGGTARNMVLSGATCLVDVRTNPSPDQQETYERLRAVVTGGELRLVSDRLRPYEIDPAHPLVAAARAARPQAALYGSRGLSDLLFFRAPGIKVGPGRTERSHTADEFVFESEILDGARFYEDVVCVYASAERGSAKREK